MKRQASEHVIQFLRNFYVVFPEYKQMDVIVFCHSVVVHLSQSSPADLSGR
jgi:hypothetical protein